MKKIKIYLVIALVSGSFVSCNNWLTLHPDNAQTTDQYWQSKQDVDQVIAAGYIKLRDCVKDQSLFIWGEIRGDGIDIINPTLNDDIKAVQKIRNVDITPDNKYVSWANMYKVIGMANSVLKYAPPVRDLDPSFSLGELNGYFCEAYFLRSLAYFYLVRTFRDVPLILEPYVEDNQELKMAKSDENVVLTQIIADLKKALEMPPKDYYPETDITNPANTKGRATVWSINALLADIYLWRGDEAQNDYQNCINACEQVRRLENSQSADQYWAVKLLSGDNWFANFFPGNSSESIFEVQFSYTKGQQTNSFMTWFGNDPTKQLYGVSFPAQMLFNVSTLLGDIRGYGASYFANDKIWKYLGFNYVTLDPATRGSTQNDQNFIIYRLADIYLMEAEAYIMKNDYTSAIDLITKIRQRAGIAGTLVAPATEIDMLDLLLDERAREFIGEGKRWFDLLRVARRHEFMYKDYMINKVLQVISPGLVSMARQKMSDPNALYLPIHRDELNANKLLVQNPYYENLGN